MSRGAIRVTVAFAAVAAVAAIAVAWWTGAPAGSAPASATQSGRTLIAMPDVARLEPRLQQQVRETYAAFARTAASGAAPAEQAEAAGSLGMLLLVTELLDAAEAALLQAEALAPADMRWPYYRAHVYRARQEPARAIPAFEAALARAPDHVPALVWLGELHLGTGDAAAAEPYLQRARALQPDSVAVLSRLGRAALARGDHARAIEYLERALALAPDASGVRYPLGMAYRDAGQPGRAEAHLRQAGDAADLMPPDPLMEAATALLQNASAHEARGMEALEARDWTAAVDHLGTAAALAPRSAVTRLNLGTALSLSGDPAGARRELLEAVRLDPGLVKAHFSLGVIAREERRWDEAIERLSTAARLDAGFVDAHFALADALRRTGRPEASLSSYTRVVELNASASQARFGYAMALVQLGRFTEARDRLQEAARLHPEQPGLAHALARVLAAAPDAAARDGVRARAIMEDLLRSSPAGSAALETMGMALAEIGQFDAAAEWQRRAIAAADADGQPALAARMQDNLARYERGEPCRTPWRPDDPVMSARGR